jgi:uncharacterized surface protein with fasciclin (FAS1) repeats
VMLRMGAATLLCTTLVSLTSAAPAQANTSWVEAFACPNGLSVFAVEDNPALGAPGVVFNAGPGRGGDVGLIGAFSGPSVPGGVGTQYVYWAELTLSPTLTITIAARGARNESYATVQVQTTCPPLGSVRGSAFEDRNANGTRDPGEPALPGMGWKLSSGGNWHICGASGGDGTFGPTVKPSTYTLTPIAPAGWRATTQPRNPLVRRLGEATLGNDLGFVRDISAGNTPCSLYEPAANTAAPNQTPVSPIEAALTSADPASYSVLLTALRSTGVLNTLDPGQTYTLFAPTNAAFNKLSARTRDRLLNDPRALTRVLRGHIVAGTLDPNSHNRLSTLAGTALYPRLTASGLRLNPRVTVSLDRRVNLPSGAIYPIDSLLTVP